MRTIPLITAALMASLALAGCFGGEEGFDFEPGKGFSETGRTVEIKMEVKDLFAHEVYPGFKANLWAFCAEGINEAGKAAIEYWPLADTDGTVGQFAENGGTQDNTCSVPGPTLRVNQGDRVIVQFENPHFHCHTIHWHGQYVPWESDGVPGATQDSVCTGGTFTYDFIAERAGTLWYHCHVDVQTHVMQGLYGVIIVEPQDTSYEPKDIDEEYVFVYSTLNRHFVEAIPGDTNPHDNHGKECAKLEDVPTEGTSGNPGCRNPRPFGEIDTWLLNGRSLPHTTKNIGEEISLENGVVRDTGSLVKLDTDERVRIRLVNAGTTFETIHTHGHDMFVTHRDGNPLHPDARFYVDTLTIGPAERYDVVVEGRAGVEGIWVMHSHVEEHTTNAGIAPGGAFTAIVYPGHEDNVRPFAIENVGGAVYEPPFRPPPDLMDSARLDVGAGSTDQSWTFPIDEEYACATKKVTVSAQLDGIENRLGAGLPTTPVTVSIKDQGGRVVATLSLSDSNDADGYTWERDLFPTGDDPEQEFTEGGDWTIDATASSSVDAELILSVFVDYDDDMDEVVAYGACGRGTGH